jgi:molybdate transport system substrate-binding protein
MNRFAATLVALLAGTAAVAESAEIKVLSAGAIEPGLKAAAAAWRKQSGHEVHITFNTAPQIQKRVAGGDAFDVVIAPPRALEEFGKAGKVGADRVNVGRVGLGAAVRPGAPVPDISSADALKRSVLAAESIVFNRASTGIYFENLLKKMGVYGEVEARTTRYADGASVMEHVLKGKGREIGFGPITEIMLHKDKGLRLVGPLPPEVQNYTSYSAVAMTAARNPGPAGAFVRFLGSGEGKALFVAAGVD